MLNFAAVLTQYCRVESKGRHAGEAVLNKLTEKSKQIHYLSFVIIYSFSKENSMLSEKFT
jgi:hypothetical protein